MAGSAGSRDSGYRLGRLAARSLGCVGVLALAGCVTVGPRFHRPQVAAPPAWTPAPAPAALAPEQEAELAHWWTNFRDPLLNSLVDRAVKSNLDLQEAEARLRQARASRGVAAAAFWPSVNATASAQHSRSTTHPKPATGPSSKSQDLFQAGLDAAWELDLFGGVRRSVEAADASVEAAAEDRRGVLVTLLSEVALNYLDLRGFQQQIVIAKNNLIAQQRNAELTRKRQRGGFVGSLDVANADAQVATTASTIPPLEAAARQAIYSLSVLLARAPSDLVAELSPPGDIPAPAVPEVPLGLPSDLLRRRPDIRRAEAQLHAATANVGVAMADLFPTFNLNATDTFQSLKVADLARTTTRTWTAGPTAAWELFAGGRITSNIRVQKALRDQALLTYRKAVLTALQDVENALVAYAKEREHRKALTDAVAANRKALEVATQLYTQGQTDFLNVIVAQGSLFAAENALVVSTLNISTNLVALYKALGGGWEEEPRPAATPPRKP